MALEKTTVVLTIDKASGRYLHKYTCKGCDQYFETKSGWKTIETTGYCKKCMIKHQPDDNKHTRPVSLKHYTNPDKIEEASSITEFCNNHPELGKNAKYHLTEVLNGRRVHYKGWMRSDNKAVVDPSKVKILYQVFMRGAISNE